MMPLVDKYSQIKRKEEKYYCRSIMIETKEFKLSKTVSKFWIILKEVVQEATT
jgi:hypothetical protein